MESLSCAACLILVSYIIHTPSLLVLSLTRGKTISVYITRPFLKSEHGSTFAVWPNLHISLVFFALGTNFLLKKDNESEMNTVNLLI